MPKTIRKCPFENCGKDCINTYCFRHQKIMGAEYPKFKIGEELYYITDKNCEGNIDDGNGEECNDICFFGDVEKYFGKSFHLEIEDTIRYNSGIYKRIYGYDSKYSYLHIILDKEKNVRGVHIALIVKYEEKYVNSDIFKVIKRGEIGGCLFPLKFGTFITLNESKYFKGAGRQIITIEPEIQE